MHHETRCRKCKDKMTVYIEDSDEKASRSFGLDVESWLKMLVCEHCEFHAKTGYKKPKNPILKL